MKDQISRGILNRTFPFFFAIDKSMVVRDAGTSLLKMQPHIIQKDFCEIFNIKRPFQDEVSFEKLSEQCEKLFLLAFKSSEKSLLYKAQLVCLKEERRIVFLGTPTFKDIEEILDVNLSLNDFAISDSSIDVLQMLQMNKLVNADLQELNRRLKLKEVKYRNLVENANEIIFTTDLNGNFTYMNDVGLRVVGLTEENIRNHRFSDLMEDQFSETIMHHGKRLLQDNESNEVAYVEFRLKNKSNFWIGQNITVIEDEQGNRGFQGIGRDISEKKEYEQIIIKEKEKAEEAAKEKSRFLANMSHEIRTPINGIVGLTNLLIGTEIDAKQKKYLNAIISSSETLMVVINDILDISKMEAGKLQFAHKSFRIETTISQLVEMMESKAGAKGLDFQYNKGALPTFLFGDEARLNQIFYNIVGNAIKFTDEGSVAISAEVTLTNDEECTLQFQVQDSGIGISAEKIKNIFSAFSQVEENDSRKYQGTGLGLTISKRLIELQGGTLSVSSELGKGSLFSIAIPFTYSNKLVEKKESEVFKPISNFFPGLQVLLVEDNPINQLVTIDLLSGKGAKVDLAENGKIAIEMLNKKDYRVVLMDMQMPVLDGYSAIKQIRKNDQLAHHKIIALTAHVNEVEVKKCYDAGADEYLSKPFQPAELFEKIYSLCSTKKTPIEACSFSSLDELTGNNTQLKLQMLTSMLSEIGADQDRLTLAIQDHDKEKLLVIVENLKATLNFSNNPLTSSFLKLEKLLESANLFNDIKPWHESLTVDLDKITTCIKKELDKVQQS